MDKALRRIPELNEQCQLEQKVKRHLENTATTVLHTCYFCGQRGHKAYKCKAQFPDRSVYRERRKLKRRQAWEENSMLEQQLNETKVKKQIEISEIDGRLSEEYEAKLQQSLAVRSSINQPVFLVRG